jgi:hypothetical protein
MTKKTLFNIAKQVRPMVVKQNTKYPSSILMEIRVARAIYKLAHGVNFLICLELFAILFFMRLFMRSIRPIGV